MKTCIGTKSFKGCGKSGDEAEFSKSYKSMCKDCENKKNRKGYRLQEHPESDGARLYNQYATIAWR